MKKIKEKKCKRLPARKCQYFEYVFTSDIVKFHGKAWSEKFFKVAGVNTHAMVPDDEVPKKYKGNASNYFYWDYTRFADVVDYGKPTYFD